MKTTHFEKIAQQFDTPTYIYDLDVLHRNIDLYKSILQSDSVVAVAIKANSNLFLLRQLVEKGCGADVVSGGELQCALAAGIPAAKIVFSGVGKTQEELTLAIKCNLLAINVESEDEFYEILSLAQKLKKRASITFRLNPDIPIDSHPKISTGGYTHKFGLPLKTVMALCAVAAKGEAFKWIKVRGIHAHIGSQIFELNAFKKLKTYFDRELQAIEGKLGYALEVINFGGGVGVDQQNNRPKWLKRWLQEVQAFARKKKYQLIVEPGRSIFADTAVLLTKVLVRKSIGRQTFLIVDAGMNDFMRTALYDAKHEIFALKKSRSRRIFQVAGPVCETTDVFRVDAKLPENIKKNDYLFLAQAGAYGYSMASQYNRRGRPAEVLIHGQKIKLIRRRELFAELISNERGLF